MRCGHAMHPKCFSQYVRTNIACPFCKKSVVDPKLIEAHYDIEIAGMPMPEEFKDLEMSIMCNDCLKKSNVKFHIMPGKCSECNSYNTTRIDDPRTNERFYQATVMVEEKRKEEMR